MVSRHSLRLSYTDVADKTNGVFKSVNKDRRPDTLVEKLYGEGWYVGEIFRKFRYKAHPDAQTRYQEGPWDLLLLQRGPLCWQVEEGQARRERNLLLHKW